VRGIKPRLVLIIAIGITIAAHPALAQQDGSVLTTLENSVTTAAKGWQTTVMQAAKSLFWILASIEVGLAALWLAIQTATLDAWFAEMVRRIMFIGFFAFVLDQGFTFAKAVVDSLYQTARVAARPHRRMCSTPVSRSPQPCRKMRSSASSRTMRSRSPRCSRW
jgi:type IV secretion system protein TrbL